MMMKKIKVTSLGGSDFFRRNSLFGRRVKRLGQHLGLAQQAAEKAACANDANEADDFELQRMIGTFKLLRSKGYTLRILPGTPEENAPVFDFATESIQPAA